MKKLLLILLQKLRFFTHRDFWWAEFFSAVGLCIWAIISVASFDAMTARNFWPLLEVADERFWENAVLIVGLLQFSALISDLRYARALVAWAAGLLLLCILLNFMQLGHFPPPATGFYFAAFATNVMAMYKNIVRPGTQK